MNNYEMNNYEEHKKFANNAAKLADILEAVPDAQHDQQNWVIEEHTCGTVACAMGWAALSGEFEGLEHSQNTMMQCVFPLGDQLYEGLRANFAVVNGKKMPFQKAGYEFFGKEITEGVFMNTTASKAHTIDRLRQFAHLHCDVAKRLSTDSGVEGPEHTG